MSNSSPRNSGRKPLGAKAMTNQEKHQKRVQTLKAQGCRAFMLWIQPDQLTAIDQMAKQNGVAPTTALRDLTQAWLDRTNGVFARVQRMAQNGASEQEQAEFIKVHFFPTLPPMEPLKALA